MNNILRNDIFFELAIIKEKKKKKNMNTGEVHEIYYKSYKRHWFLSYGLSGTGDG